MKTKKETRAGTRSNAVANFFIFALLRRRLTQLEDATTLEEVRNLPGNYHELKNDRKGQWGCDLDQPYRLVFTPHENPIPANEDGQYIWLEITGVEVIEIINYHKEK